MMCVWNNCLVDIVYYDETIALTNEAGYQVRIDDDEIVVSYEDDEGWVEYCGKANGAGHFELSAPERDGKASLHRFPDGNTLEGYWVERGYRGMWRIELT